MEDLSHLTGEDKMRKPPEGIKCNEISLQGKTGSFIYRDLINRKEGEKPEVRELGQSIKVVFLKHRRRLAYWNARDKKMLMTTEHNAKGDLVYLFGEKERGIADMLRAKYPQLRTQQVVYAYLVNDTPAEGEKPELVRIILKGSALGSEGTAKGVLKYYDYLSSFSQTEHSYEYITELTGIEEVGNLGQYYTVSFVRGAKLNSNQLGVVASKIKEIAVITKAQDDYYIMADEGQVKKADLPTVEYPDETEDAINPDDIPF